MLFDWAWAKEAGTLCGKMDGGFGFYVLLFVGFNGYKNA
jgi:hypothetical protein